MRTALVFWMTFAGCACALVIIKDVIEFPARVREFRQREAACNAHVCPSGWNARMIVPRYESALCVCKVNQ